MKAYKHDIKMRCGDDWEFHRAMETVKTRSVDESVAVEFGTVENLGDNQFRYKYNDSLHSLLLEMHMRMPRAMASCHR